MAILIDFGHMSSRMHHVAISEVSPSIGDNGKYDVDEYFSYFCHLVLQNIKSMKQQFEREYGEIVICIDAKHYWRKDIYPEYKGQRKAIKEESKIDFSSFYSRVDEFLEDMESPFPFKFLNIEKAEADDTIGVMSKELNDKKIPTIVVTSDKDMKQVLQYDYVKLYDDKDKKWEKLPKKDIPNFKIYHVLKGDASDNIFNIKQRTEFSNDFMLHLEKHMDFFYEHFDESCVMSDVKVIQSNSFVYSTIVDDFDIYKVYKTGKNKGKNKLEKNVFATIPFGDIEIYKFMEDLEVNLSKHKMYKDAYNLNEELVLFDHIPNYIHVNTKESYYNQEVSYDQQKMVNFFNKYKLKKMLGDMPMFLKIHGQEVKTSVSFDW
jgi:5'-3' exonuclease